VLEGLSVLAGGIRDKFVPNTPNRLCAARTCYDHLAGRVGVSLHDRFHALHWLSAVSKTDNAYELTPAGSKAFEALGIDLQATRALRRRFACACLDWSGSSPAEDRPEKKMGDPGPRQQSARHHPIRQTGDAESVRPQSLIT
jgi:hypothetical protein